MEIIRQNFWLFVGAGIFLTTLIMGLILFCICSSQIRKGKKKENTDYKSIQQPKTTEEWNNDRFFVVNSIYHNEKLEDIPPPLPERNIEKETGPGSPQPQNMSKLTREEPDLEQIQRWNNSLYHSSGSEDQIKKKIKKDYKNPAKCSKAEEKDSYIIVLPENGPQEEYDDVIAPGWISEDYDDIENSIHSH
ncbi:SLP adapter and CSK-interacting membrane protein [Protopterus annectens]|uniref:SLP adapter and CSK-interacting membrane protein n=1 Tax=Protopterus annectens TaxID=7888 RepID=UPI001CF9C57A|nr:SLP adapter and CSK-interacting membrane protein [Protopterus annectens]XP_043938845.1 SLP adapter and CSK-interacting membrane protein [Protopterus annectens]